MGKKKGKKKGKKDDVPAPTDDMAAGDPPDGVLPPPPDDPAGLDYYSGSPMDSLAPPPHDLVGMGPPPTGGSAPAAFHPEGGPAAMNGAFQPAIPPPDGELPPPAWPEQQELMDRQLELDRLRTEVETKRSQREQARGMPDEAQLAAELQELEVALDSAERVDWDEQAYRAPAATGWEAKLNEQAATRSMFEHFSGGKGYMDRTDVVASIHYLDYDCDDEYCTQLLHSFAAGAESMDSDSFAKMWAHMAPQPAPDLAFADEHYPGGSPDEHYPGGLPDHPGPDGADSQSKQPDPDPEPAPVAVQDSNTLNTNQDQKPEPEPEPDPTVHLVVDEEWKQRRLEELKAKEEERLLEEARAHVRTKLHEEDDLAHMLRDDDILRALFSRVDPGSTGRTSRIHWLKFLKADDGILKVMKLNDLEPSELDKLFSRWPATGITFPAFVALLRTQFGRALGLEYKYHDEVKAVQELEQKLHKQMLARGDDRRKEEQKAKDLERERLRQEVMDEMREQQRAELTAAKKEILEKLSKETDLESQSLLEAQLAEVKTAMMGLESLSEWPKRLQKLEQARADRAEELKKQAIALEGKAVVSEDAALAAAGWFTAQDQTGRIYYYNRETHATSWEVPSVAALPSPPPPPPAPGAGTAIADESSVAASQTPPVSNAPATGAAAPTDGEFTTDTVEVSPADGDLLHKIRQADALLSTEVEVQVDNSGNSEREQENIGQLTLEAGRSSGRFGESADLIEAEAHNSLANPAQTTLVPTSPVQALLAQSLAAQSQDGTGKRESIADRSRRLREVRKAEATSEEARMQTEQSLAEDLPSALTSTTAPAPAGSIGSSLSVAKLSSVSRLLSVSARNSGGSLGAGAAAPMQTQVSSAFPATAAPAQAASLSTNSRLASGGARSNGSSGGNMMTAVGSSMGLLAARRAQREAEKNGGVSLSGLAASATISARLGTRGASSDRRSSTSGAGVLSSYRTGAAAKTETPDITAESARTAISSSSVPVLDEGTPPRWAVTRRAVAGGRMQDAGSMSAVASAAVGGKVVFRESGSASRIRASTNETPEAPPPWESKQRTQTTGSSSEPWKRA